MHNTLPEVNNQEQFNEILTSMNTIEEEYEKNKNIMAEKITQWRNEKFGDISSTTQEEMEKTVDSFIHNIRYLKNDKNKLIGHTDSFSPANSFHYNGEENNDIQHQDLQKLMEEKGGIPIEEYMDQFHGNQRCNKNASRKFEIEDGVFLQVYTYTAQRGSIIRKSQLYYIIDPKEYDAQNVTDKTNNIGYKLMESILKYKNTLEELRNHKMGDMSEIKKEMGNQFYHHYDRTHMGDQLIDFTRAAKDLLGHYSDRKNLKEDEYFGSAKLFDHEMRFVDEDFRSERFGGNRIQATNHTMAKTYNIYNQISDKLGTPFESTDEPFDVWGYGTSKIYSKTFKINDKYDFFLQCITRRPGVEYHHGCNISIRLIRKQDLRTHSIKEDINSQLLENLENESK